MPTRPIDTLIYSPLTPPGPPLHVPPDDWARMNRSQRKDWRKHNRSKWRTKSSVLTPRNKIDYRDFTPPVNGRGWVSFLSLFRNSNFPVFAYQPFYLHSNWNSSSFFLKSSSFHQIGRESLIGGLTYWFPPIEAHAREALQPVIVLIWAATRKKWTDAKEERRRKSWRCRRRFKKKKSVREIESADPII